MPTTQVCFIVESGTDVRMVDGLADRFSLSVLTRRITNGVEISWPPSRQIEVEQGPSSRLAFSWKVLRYLLGKRRACDVVIVQGYSLAALAANVASRLTGTPTLMLVCSPVEDYYRCRLAYPVSDKAFRRHELWLLELLARINGVIGRQYIVLSQYLAGVIRRYGTNKPVTFIPIYGIDTEKFAPPVEPKLTIRARLGLPLSGSLIFFSSRIAPEKDSETLLEAVKLLIDEGRDVWLLHRSGGYRSFIKDAEIYGIAARVISTDAVHPHRQLPLDYQACDVCVQASRAEGLGFSPLEALACETPVVVTAVGGLRETIIDGQTGWTYPVGNAEALASRLSAALDDPNEASRRAKAGRRLVVERFDRQKVFARLEQIIEQGKGPLSLEELIEVP